MSVAASNGGVTFATAQLLTTGGESSTGLGLSIVKSLVEAHHGTIKVKSEGKDKGAVFIVELPLVSA